MGRYTNVQSFADDSPAMRTVSYAQATGMVANNATTSMTRSPTRDERGEGNASDTASSASTKNQPTKSDDNNKSQKEIERSAGPSPQCETTTLFVGGLQPRIGELHLQKLFSPYGEIVRINVVMHNPSLNPKPADLKSNPRFKSEMPARYMAALQQSKGYAFVEYRSIESARLAISRLDGRRLLGRSLAVRPAHKKLGDLATGVRDSSGSRNKDSKVTAEEARREYGAIQSKIDAVKRAIELKKKGI